ncbi:MAG: alpha-2-macroglobulin family protein [Planctomycetota bacterium]
MIGPEDQVKAGGKVKFTIAADYYSGGGVPGATVKYRVFRRSWHPFFSRPDRWAYLYGRRSPSSLWGGRELVVEAEGRSDEAGRLEVLVDTAAMTAAHPEEHHRLEIEADVTDLSRRTISGSGEVIAARTAIFAQVSSERGFHRAGEKAEFSIRAVRPSGEGVATRGRAVVYRLTDRRRPDGDVETTRTQQHVAELATDEAGEGRFSWTFDAPGRFAVAYETEDVWGGRVTGEAVTWVTAPGYRADEFLVRDIEVVTDRDTYQPGETAYILLNGTYEDAAVLLTIEADRTILKHEVIRLDGQTKVLALPITDAFGPNCFLHATMVQGGTFFESHVELRVPPTRRFLDVSLTSARDTYRPGEMVDLRLSSRDSQGRPVPARFALRVMDRAITYIAADGTPDVRTFFYGDRRGFNGGSSWGGNTRNSVAFRFGGHLIDQPTRRRWRRHGAPIGTWFDYSHADAAILDLRSNVVNLDRAAGEEPEEESEDFAGGFAEGKADAAPSAAAPMRSEATREMLRGRAKKSADKGVYGDSLRLDDHDLEADPGSAPVEVRRNFSDLAAWEPELHTDAAGVATVSFRLPDSLTTWVATARGLTTDTRVGQDEVQFKTTKNLLIRLQAPRFFTERDEVVLSGVIRNAYDEDLPVTASLDLEGGELELLDRPDQEVVVTAGGEKRVDWLVRVLRSGEARLKMTARSARESDAVAMSFPVLEYGRDRVVTQTEVLTGGDARQVFAIDVPADRRVGSTRLELTLAPSLGATLLEALPYLIEYPYGCTEQTMSRFMPAVVVARALKDSGTSLEEIAAKRRDLDEREAHAISDRRPIWTDAELEDVVSSGLRRLEGMQNPDGGFGWWRLDRSSVHLTSYVLHGLCEARRAGYEVPSAMIDRAVRFLRGEAGEISGLELATYAAFAMAEAGHKEPKLLDHVWDARDRLGSFAKAQLALAFHRVEDEARAKALLRSLEDFAEVDEKNGTCHWPARGSWWYWHGDEIETNAAVLLAVATIEPEHRLARPLASWLVRNRSGNRWKSTRDTAASVLALARFMKGAGELDPNYTVDVRFGDGPARTSRVDRATMFTFDNRLVLEGDAVETGRRDLVIEKKGPGVLYLDARLSYFSTEEKIAAAGHGVEVARSYFLLTPTTRTEKRGDEEITVRDFERTKLDDLAEVSAGAEVEVVMTLTVDNDYEYVMVEDRKPSGFEPVELRSGGRYANGLCSNMELRDEKVVFFVTWLQQGKHRIAYRMRAEVPGRIHAMPCRAVAMYAPRLGGISDSWMVRVEDPTR